MNCKRMLNFDINNNNDVDNKNVNNGKGKKKNSANIKNKNKNNNNNILGTRNAQRGNTKAELQGKKERKEEYVCICQRTRKVYECSRCHFFFYGRIQQTCKKHPLDLYLMDFRSCPHCLETTEKCEVSDLSLETVQKMENAELPEDYDL